MTIKNRCVACDFVIEAPDAMRGRETACPECAAPNVLLSPTDASLREGAAQESAGARTAVSLTLQAGQRLRDVSLYLLGFAYLILLLFIVLGGVLAAGLEVSVTWRAVAFMGCALAGIFSYVYLKFMSDAVRALADLGRAIESRMSLVLEKLEDTSTIPPRHPDESG